MLSFCRRLWRFRRYKTRVGLNEHASHFEAHFSLVRDTDLHKKRIMAIAFSLGANFFQLATFSCVIVLCAVTGALPIASSGSGGSGSGGSGTVEELNNATMTCSYQSNINELFVGLQVLQKYCDYKYDPFLVSIHVLCMHKTQAEFMRLNSF